MDEGTLRQLLDDVRSGALHPDDAVTRMRHLPFTDLGFARVDHHRELRQGMAEAVYAPGKSPAHSAAIVGELLASGSTAPVILSRAGTDTVHAATDANPGGTVQGDPGGRAGATVVWRPAEPRPASDAVVVVTAGTADLPVADEAVAVLGAHGIPVERFTDVGVAGLHRLLDALPSLTSARAVIVVAGMEGALASLVGGLTPAPVVAVPTSVGYGASLEGVTALLAMLASCASGLTVVGIDNGFGAAHAIVRLLGPVTLTAPTPAAAPNGHADPSGPRQPPVAAP
ncbi:MAG TPA: nickel pincer cofactor biosynthesis protein LarB [Acidimicrobiales bacterium]